MAWKDLDYQGRASVLTSGVQAAATLGMFLIALIGIWKVTPIITYQVQQQESALSQIAVDDHTHPLVLDALSWWGGHVQCYDELVEILGDARENDPNVSFEILPEAGAEIVPGLRPDLLVVTAIDKAGKEEKISVPVNNNAMQPSQYIQFKLNQGAFADLPDAQRQRVEIAVERYLKRVMMPVVPPLIVRADMSLKELHSEISSTRQHREEALRHIKRLQEVITAAMEEP